MSNGNLILTRRAGESLLIGDGIKITIHKISGGQCRIGIECDRSIPVHRQEVYDAIKRCETQDE